MWKKMRKKAKEAIEKLRKEKREKKAEVGKEEEATKKEPAKKVDEGREKADKALGRLRMFVPKTLPIAPIKGKPVIEIYNGRDAYRDIQTILHYLMGKKGGE